jgi:hypothetical protein
MSRAPYWCDDCGGLVFEFTALHENRTCYVAAMTTELPAGWWVRSNVADRTLEWGYEDEVYGDYVDPIWLSHIVGDVADEEQRRRLSPRKEPKP